MSKTIVDEFLEIGTFKFAIRIRSDVVELGGNDVVTLELLLSKLPRPISSELELGEPEPAPPAVLMILVSWSTG